MSLTKLLYLENFTTLRATATVLDVVGENGKAVVILDQTIFYPQGGGQPYDQGVIEGAAKKFFVEEVRFVDSIVKHIGKFEGAPFQTGESIICIVNEARRTLNSRLHSAGHVVDMGVRALGLTWTPGKGYHFPDGPYVEYDGVLDGLAKDKIKIDLETVCNKFVVEGWETTLKFMDKEHMHEACAFVPDYIPEGKPARVVLFGDFGVPCGGTHVRNLREIGHVGIRKIKATGAKIRVAYDV